MPTGERGILKQADWSAREKKMFKLLNHCSGGKLLRLQTIYPILFSPWFNENTPPAQKSRRAASVAAKRLPESKRNESPVTELKRKLVDFETAWE